MKGNEILLNDGSFATSAQSVANWTCGCGWLWLVGWLVQDGLVGWLLVRW